MGTAVAPRAVCGNTGTVPVSASIANPCLHVLVPWRKVQASTTTGAPAYCGLQTDDSPSLDPVLSQHPQGVGKPPFILKLSSVNETCSYPFLTHLVLIIPTSQIRKLRLRGLRSLESRSVFIQIRQLYSTPSIKALGIPNLPQTQEDVSRGSRPASLT